VHDVSAFPPTRGLTRPATIKNRLHFRVRGSAPETVIQKALGKSRRQCMERLVISVVSSETPRIGRSPETHLMPEPDCPERDDQPTVCHEKQTDTDLVDPAGRERMIRTYAGRAWMAQALTKLRRHGTPGVRWLSLKPPRPLSRGRSLVTDSDCVLRKNKSSALP
jgi:hypothetical protein